jgi:hypothetical protein
MTSTRPAEPSIAPGAQALPRRHVVAVMQPYFAPYAGYYRLMAAADVFVIYDCVQFPRRGWVHRNRLPDARGEPAWLTLPLEHAPFEAPISSLVFAADARARMNEARRRYPSLERPGQLAEAFLNAGPFEGAFVDYIEQQLIIAREILGFDCRIVRSSAFDIDPALRAQDRILAILERLGATDYVNAPGGRDLYDEPSFRARRIGLHFLPDHQGPNWSLLHRLASEDPAMICAEILDGTPMLQSSWNTLATAEGVATASEISVRSGR